MGLTRQKPFSIPASAIIGNIGTGVASASSASSSEGADLRTIEITVGSSNINIGDVIGIDSNGLAIKAIGIKAIGISTQNYTSGNIAKIQVLGNINLPIQLVSGKQYFINSSGDLELFNFETNKQLIGVALSESIFNINIGEYYY